MSAPDSHRTLSVPGFTTQGGATLDVEIAYSTRGRLSASRDNAILVLTSYAAQHDEAERRPLREVGEVGVDGAHEAAPGRSSMSSMAAVAR